MSRYIKSVLVLLIGQVGLQAQTPTAPLLPGEIPSLNRTAEVKTQNVLLIGARVANDYDDNVLNDDHNKRANLLTSIQPHLGWSLSSRRATWLFDYRPGFSYGQPMSAYDSRSQLLDTNVHLALTKRLKARLRESVLRSKSTFDQWQQSELTSGSSVLDRPNDSVLAAVQESSEQAGGDLSYTLSPRTMIGGSTSFYRVNYSSALSTRALGSVNSVGAHALSSYRLTRHHWVGLDYNLQNLTSQLPQSRSFVQSMLYIDTLVLRPSMSVSFFIGPQHSLTRGGSALSLASARSHDSVQANWSWAGGVNYVWTNARTSLTFGLVRRISDGAGFQGIVELSSATIELRRQVSRHWRGKLSFSDNRNAPIELGFTPLSYVSFASGISRALNPRLSVECLYWHVHETSSTDPLGSSLADHNRISMSVEYNLKVALQQ